MNSIKAKSDVIIATHRTSIPDALAEMTRAFFAYWFQLDADSQMSVVMTFELKPIADDEPSE